MKCSDRRDPTANKHDRRRRVVGAHDENVSFLVPDMHERGRDVPAGGAGGAGRAAARARAGAAPHPHVPRPGLLGRRSGRSPARSCIGLQTHTVLAVTMPVMRA